MEMFELRYFLAIAAEENIHRASAKTGFSPASLSKAVARLEDELGVRLFAREGKTIRLNAFGKLLQTRASEIVHLEESTKLALSGEKGFVHAVVAGPEVLLARFGIELCARVKKRHPLSSVEYKPCEEKEAIKAVKSGQAHFALLTKDEVPGLSLKNLQNCIFQTCVGKKHPLYAHKGGTLPVETVLEHGFASPNHPLLGSVSAHQSLDGWRDDKFPRKIDYFVSSLKVLEELVVQGLAVAYLPDYVVKTLDVAPLKISGCPYSCKQTVSLATRSKQEIGWLRQVL
ncbi:LysR family transcriptional regulator [bacterium]|nr:LysR family transcriptional regulator [bacterium]